MIYGYIRVSTDRPTTENQRFEILEFADEKRLHIDQWVEETISATKHLDDRQLGQLLNQLQADDILIVTELSRIGRSILEVMSVLHRIMETEAKVFTTKERYELGNTISSKVLAFAFSLSSLLPSASVCSPAARWFEPPRGEFTVSIHPWTVMGTWWRDKQVILGIPPDRDSYRIGWERRNPGTRALLIPVASPLIFPLDEKHWQAHSSRRKEIPSGEGHTIDDQRLDIS